MNSAEIDGHRQLLKTPIQLLNDVSCHMQSLEEMIGSYATNVDSPSVYGFQFMVQAIKEKLDRAVGYVEFPHRIPVSEGESEGGDE